MNTMYQQTPTLSIGRRPLTTKVAQAFLALAMLAILAAPVQLTVNSIGEEIPTPRRPVASSIGEEIPTPRRPVVNHIGEEIPQGVNLSGEEVAGGVAGGVVWNHQSKERG